MNMKTTITLCLMTVAALVSGCATGRTGLVLDAVGPGPEPVTAGNATSGALVVYSAYEQNADFNSRDSYRQECSDYKIFTPDGKLLKRVHNVSNNIFQTPVLVTLPVGTYQVSARANGYGTVTVPVLVQPRATTTLHLEGGGFWPDRSGFTQDNTSHLPDGRIIGWKANL